MKRSIDAAVADLFSKLPFEPSPEEIAKFEQDLRVVSPTLVAGAIEEIVATTPKLLAKGEDWRTSIYKVYNRKVAEHAQLFPLFHSFETAYRSIVATTLEAHYGKQDWWQPVLQEMQSSGGNPKNVTHLGQQAVKADIPFRISKLLDSLIQKKLPIGNYKTGYDLLQECELAQIIYLIDDHWSLFAPRFQFNGQLVSNQAVMGFFERVRKARNAVYHHQSFSGFSDLYMAAKFLLDCFGFPLPRVHFLVANSRCARPPYFPSDSMEAGGGI